MFLFDNNKHYEDLLNKKGRMHKVLGERKRA
jgi:hypothetical protein